MVVSCEETFEVYGAELDVGFLSRCAVLAKLCSCAYQQAEKDVGTSFKIALPNLEKSPEPVKEVDVELLHFREGSSGFTSVRNYGEQQLGVWKVSGENRSDNFLVVAFRGTASMSDVITDLKISRPVELSQGLRVHRGFYRGASKHVDEIVHVLERQSLKDGERLPVWVTGHSLGGAYANALILHLLDSKRTNHLFTRGGGSCTYGAPMTVYAEDREKAYSRLAALEAEVELERGCSLKFHNFVNNADLVPRLLGVSLTALYGLLAGFSKSMPWVKDGFFTNLQETARNYHPFGQYHMIVGTDIRSFQMPKTKAGVSSRLGNAHYAKILIRELNPLKLYKGIKDIRIHLTKSGGGGWTAHNMPSYAAGLTKYLQFLFQSQLKVVLAQDMFVRQHAFFTSRKLRLKDPIYKALKQRAYLVEAVASATEVEEDLETAEEAQGKEQTDAEGQANKVLESLTSLPNRLSPEREESAVAAAIFRIAAEAARRDALLEKEEEEEEVSHTRVAALGCRPAWNAKAELFETNSWAPGGSMASPFGDGAGEADTKPNGSGAVIGKLQFKRSGAQMPGRLAKIHEMEENTAAAPPADETDKFQDAFSKVMIESPFLAQALESSTAWPVVEPCPSSDLGDEKSAESTASEVNVFKITAKAVSVNPIHGGRNMWG